MSNRFWKRSEGLEDRLRAARPQAPERLVRSIADSITPRPLRSRSGRSLGFVAALGVATIALLGASGGFSYAANGVAGAVHSAVRLASGPPTPPNTNLPRSTGGSSGSSSSNSATCAQYGHTATITKVSPAFGKAGSATVITVTGTNLQGATVTAAGDSTTIKSNTDKKIMFTLNASNVGGTGAVVASTCVGDASWSTFSVYATPNNIHSDHLSLETGMVLHLTGAGFTGVKANGVKFGTTPSKDAVVVDDSHITVSVPALTKTSGTMTVTSPAGTGTGEAWTYSATAPTIKSVALPAGLKGAVAGTTLITLTGANFANTDTITVGGVDATNVTWNGTTGATFNADPSTPGGSQTVKITDTLGGSATSKAITIFVSPHATGGSPAIDTTGDGLFGTKAGGSITITGSGLTGTSAIRFHNSAKDVKPAGKVADGSFKVTVPKDAASGDITITNPAGQTTLSGFTLLTLKPTADPHALAHPGDTITVTGTGFLGVSKVTVGGKTATITAINAAGTSLSFTIPSTVKMSSKAAPVVITNPVGTSSKYSIVVN